MKKLINKFIDFVKKNKMFVITITILLGGQSLTYCILKYFQTDPIYINYYLDDRIPFIGRFVHIYNSFYPFVFLSLYLLYKKDAKAYYRGIISGIIGFLICDIIFLTIPTIMYRPIIPSISPFTDFVLKVTYYFDTPPLNCFPSIHCLFCFQVIYSYIFSKYNDIPKKVFIILYALLVISSTLFIKQHFIYDVISALSVMLISNILEKIFNIYEKLKKKKFIKNLVKTN